MYKKGDKLVITGVTGNLKYGARWETGQVVTATADQAGVSIDTEGYLQQYKATNIVQVVGIGDIKLYNDVSGLPLFKEFVND